MIYIRWSNNYYYCYSALCGCVKTEGDRPTRSLVFSLSLDYNNNNNKYHYRRRATGRRPPPRDPVRRHMRFTTTSSARNLFSHTCARGDLRHFFFFFSRSRFERIIIKNTVSIVHEESTCVNACTRRIKVTNAYWNSHKACT